MSCNPEEEFVASKLTIPLGDGSTETVYLTVDKAETLMGDLSDLIRDISTRYPEEVVMSCFETMMDIYNLAIESAGGVENKIQNVVSRSISPLEVADYSYLEDPLKYKCMNEFSQLSTSFTKELDASQMMNIEDMILLGCVGKQLELLNHNFEEIMGSLNSQSVHFDQLHSTITNLADAIHNPLYVSMYEKLELDTITPEFREFLKQLATHLQNIENVNLEELQEPLRNIVRLLLLANGYFV